MSAAQGFLRTDGLGEEPVHFQRVHRGAAGGCAPRDAAALPLKVIGPALGARVKKLSLFPGQRICCLAACAFAQGTGDAGEGEIFERGRAGLSQRLDVIHMKLRLLPNLGESAVFATTARTIQNRAPQRDWHLHAAAACGRNARSFRSDIISAISTNPSASLRSAAVRGVP